VIRPFAELGGSFVFTSFTVREERVAAAALASIAGELGAWDARSAIRSKRSQSRGATRSPPTSSSYRVDVPGRELRSWWMANVASNV